jgi:hypothetical protein
VCISFVSEDVLKMLSRWFLMDTDLSYDCGAEGNLTVRSSGTNWGCCDVGSTSCTIVTACIDGVEYWNSSSSSWYVIQFTTVSNSVLF